MFCAAMAAWNSAAYVQFLWLDGTICGEFAGKRERSRTMQAEAFQTPVAFFVFKRPDTTRRVFEAISKVRPAKLLLIADGPRMGKEGEIEACRGVREIVARVDWPCEVMRNFSETNLGCRERMISGINWLFSLVEDAIILEDDCLPDLSFFPYCQELLEKYRGDSRIAYISGCNLIERYMTIEDSYCFSRIGGIWGWATWRSEWQRYDRNLSDWPGIKSRCLLTEVFDDPSVVKYLTAIFDAMYENRGPDTWDYQWLYTCLKNNSIAIVPRVNLIANIGFGKDGTHTIKPDERMMFSAAAVQFPLQHPFSLIPLLSLDRHRVRNMLPRSVPRRILRQLFRIARHFLDHGVGSTKLF